MDHQINHRNQDPCLAAFGQVFVVFAQPSIAAQPAKGSLHNPAALQDDEPFVGPFDDFDDPGKCRQGPADKLPGVAAVGPDQSQAREASGQALENQPPAVAILDVGSVNDHGDDQSQRVDGDVALASDDLFAGVIASASAPFSALLTLWLSMIAALGVACLPALRRTRSRSVS